MCFNRRGVNVCLFVTSAIWCMCFVDSRAQPAIGVCLEMTGSVLGFFFFLSRFDRQPWSDRKLSREKCVGMWPRLKLFL